MFKNLFNKAKCKLGFHKGEWKYDRAGNCNQTRICDRCGQDSTRLSHAWQEWLYDQADTCDQTKTCNRCGEQEHKVAHTWGKEQYKNNDSCVQIHCCERCHTEKIGRKVHRKLEWNYSIGSNCQQVQICGTCGENTRKTRLAHDWGDWQYNPNLNTTVRVCRRCGEFLQKTTE